MVFAQTLVPGAVGEAGVGLTVMVYIFGVPAHPFTVGVTVMIAVTAVAPVLLAVNAGVFPVPLAASPIEGSELVHANVPPEGILTKADAVIMSPLQTTMLTGTVVTGVGSTMMV